MKRLLFTLIVLGATVTGSFAQNPDSSASKGGTKLSVGVEAGLPVGDASDVYSWLIGGSLKVEIPTATNTFLTLSAGYSSFQVKSDVKDLLGISTDNFVPIKAGIKCYTGGNFFVEGQAGIVFSTADGGGHAFVYSPGVGYSFSGGFEAGVRFEGWTNGGSTNQVGLRVAYRF